MFTRYARRFSAALLLALAAGLPLSARADRLSVAAVAASGFRETDGPQVPENAADGRPETIWAPAEGDAWVQLYLDANDVKVDSLRVHWGDGGEAAATVRIETSRDGAAWEGASTPPRGSGVATYPVPAVSARYVRLSLPAAASAPVREIEVHGSGRQDAGIAFPVAGRIAPRPASAVRDSPWSIGAETMDRSFTLYAQWKPYLGPLGAKRARVQAGWARVERERGVYDWAWLDDILRDMARQGVTPWLGVSYGNPLYPGGGGPGLGDGLPTSDEALAAWDRWVRALTGRYGDIVREWEIWNEPNLSSGKNPPEVYARFLLRTADTIRLVQPNARIVAGAVAGIDTAYVTKVLTVVRDAGGLDRIHEISYHPYNANPDASYAGVERLRAAVAGFSPAITLRQGENGAPSNPRTRFALANHPWTELSQAKWNLRRLLGDHARGIPSNLFTMADMHYTKPVPYWNTKGLLLARGDLGIVRPKAAYAAMQHLTAIFDERLTPLAGFTAERSPAEPPLAIHGFAEAATGRAAVAVWNRTKAPGDTNDKTPVDLTFPDIGLTDPVLVDLRTGIVYDIPAAARERNGRRWTFRGVPTYDSPVLIVDRGLVPLSDRR